MKLEFCGDMLASDAATGLSLVVSGSLLFIFQGLYEVLIATISDQIRSFTSC